MTNGYEILAECRTYPQLVAALRERLISHTQSSLDKIEDIADLPAGYLSKLTAKRHNRGLGNLSLGPLLTISGVMLLVAVDPTTIDAARKAAARKQITLERGRFDPHKHKMAEVAGGAMQAVRRPQNRTNYKNGDWGKQMRARQIIKTTPTQRKKIARTAARARWAKLRRELATSCA